METQETKYQNDKLNEKFDISKNEQGFLIKDGKYEKWYENGNKECEGEYIENIKFGYWKFWYENGEVKEEGEYFNDEKGENWKTYPVSKPEVTEEVKKIDLKPKSTISATSAISTPTISEKQTIENNKKIIKEKEIVQPIPILQKPDPSYIINDIQKRETNIQKPVAAKDNKTIYVVLGGVGFLLIVILLYVFVIKNDSKKELIETKVTSTTQEDTRKRELELKERELALKEKELEKQKTEQPNINSPEGVVTKFIQSLGKQDWSAAFGLMTEKRRGNYTTFSSTKGYGGITSTKIYSCSYTGETNGKKEVMVDYESIDPANKSGRIKQYFYLTPLNDSYLITEIKNISIEWF